MLDGLLDDYDGPLSVTRNATPRSRLAEDVVRAFLAGGAPAASVRWERSGYGLDELYKGLWNACSKPPYKRLVAVSRRGRTLILKRIGGFGNG
jgi:CRISPR/Cas system-associated protein Csm6